MDEQRVWLSSRKCKAGRTYHLRWQDVEGWHSEAVGTDRKAALRAKAIREQQIEDGTFKVIPRTPWADFTAEVTRFLSGRHAVEARHVLAEFALVCNPSSPKVVTHRMIRAYVEHIREKGNAIATENKKLRYLRLAFREGVALDFMATDPMAGWKWRKEPKKTLRILTQDEEPKLLAACDKVGGFPMVMFARFLLVTWARFGEAVKLGWEDVDFEGRAVTFKSTKSAEDRYVPLSCDAFLADLRRLQAMTLHLGGPFRRYADNPNFSRRWNRVLALADIPPISRHDLRRTGISRALLAGMPVTVVMRLAGHKNMATTQKYYTEVSKGDLRAAVDKCHAAMA